MKSIEEEATEVRKRDQGELPGIRPKYMKRLEEIEDDVRKNEGKIAKLRKENRELSDEAVAICEEHDAGTHVNGPDEWYVDEGRKRYKHRRFKDTKEKPGKKPEGGAAKKEKAAG